MKNLSRREMLKLMGITMAAGTLAACGPAATTAPQSVNTPLPAATSPSPTVDPYGKYETTVILKRGNFYTATDKYPEGDSPESNQYTRYVKDMLNVDVQSVWSAAIGDNYDQKVNLAIASNDLPDAMVVNLAQLKQMIRADQLADLTDTYNQYASSNIKQFMDSSKGLCLNAVTVNGKILAIPSLNVPDDGYHIAWIRKDWLDKLGLAAPKTIDDLENLAKAFVEQDPGGNGPGNTIGITGPQNGGAIAANFLVPNNNSFGFDPIFAAYHAYPGFWVKGADGKAAYGSVLPETKVALAKLADLYTKGLIDKQTGVRKDATEPIVSGTVGIYFGVWWAGYWPLPDAIKNNPAANWQAYAIPLDVQGIFNPHMGTPATTFVVVRKGYEHPEAVMKIVNIINRDEAKFDATKGDYTNEPLRIPISMYDDAAVTYQSLKDILAGKAQPEDFADPKWNVYKLLKTDAANIKTVKIEPYDKMDISAWNPQANLAAWERLYSIMVGCGAIYNPDVKMNKVFSLIYYSTETMNTKWVNLKTLEDETFLKIILGYSPVDSFDQFVIDWKAQGGDQITTEVQSTLS